MTGGPENRGLEPERFLEMTDLSQTKAEYDAIAEEYESSLLNDFGWRGHERIAALAAPRIDREAPLLDAGCGSGIVGVALADQGFTTIDGFDISEAMLEQTRPKGIYRDLKVGILGEPLDYPTDAYQGIFASGMFTPGHAPPSSLDEMIRVVAPGGFVIFSLRDDREIPGFPEKIEQLEASGRWKLAERGERFQSMPVGEPEMRHRIWCYEVL